MAVDAYENSGYWCWIRINDIDAIKRDLLVIFMFYLYLWLAMIYNSIVIFMVFKYFRRLEDHFLLSRCDSRLEKITWFPVAMLACWLVPSFYRIFQMAGFESFWFFLAHAICEGVNGLANGLLYAFNKKFKEEIKQSISVINGEKIFRNI